jgi:3-isopropylmalate/(R)-2-methylmalate dehydratase small subunit
VIDPASHAWLLEHPGVEVSVDVGQRALTLPDGRAVEFPIEAFARYCLMNGVDELGYLLGQAERIDAFEHAHP